MAYPEEMASSVDNDAIVPTGLFRIGSIHPTLKRGAKKQCAYGAG